MYENPGEPTAPLPPAADAYGQDFSMRVGVWEQSSQPSEAIGALRAKPSAAGGWRSESNAPSRRRQGVLQTEPPAMDDFCNFSIKISRFYANISINIVILKPTSHQLNPFEKQSRL